MNINCQPHVQGKIKKTVVLSAGVILCLILFVSLLVGTSSSTPSKTTVKPEAQFFVPQKPVLFDKQPDTYSEVKPKVPQIPILKRLKEQKPIVEKPQNSKDKNQESLRNITPKPPMEEEARKSGLFANSSNGRNEANIRGPIRDKELLGSLNSKHSGLLENVKDMIGNISDTGENESIKNQQMKNKFMESDGLSDSEIHLQHRVQQPISPFQIMAGSIIPAVLLTGVNSDLPGIVVAQVRQHIYDSKTGNHLLIPQGTRIIGKYHNLISYGQNRILLKFHRIMFSNNSSISLDGMPGSDLYGYAGLNDKVNNHLKKILGAIILSSFFNIGSNRVDNEDSAENNLINNFLGSAASEANKVGQKLLNKQINIPPTIEIRQGYKFNITVHKDIIFEEEYK